MHEDTGRRSPEHRARVSRAGVGEAAPNGIQPKNPLAAWLHTRHSPLHLPPRCPPPPSFGAATLTVPRLLLVEDDFASHQALRRLFLRQGWEVLSAMTVAGGLA